MVLQVVSLVVGIFAIILSILSAVYSRDNQNRSEKILRDTKNLQSDIKESVNDVRKDVESIKSDLLERDKETQELLRKMAGQTAQPSLNEASNMIELLNKIDPEMIEKIEKMQGFGQES